MNNRYTYKAKRKDNGEWVYGYYYYLPLEDKHYIQLGNTYSDSSSELYSREEIIFETLCQCTGLQDIEGNYIFENDMLQVPLFIEDNQKAMCIYNQENNVNNIIGFGLYTYDNYHQRYSNLVQSDEWDEFKIIGNKFDKEE